MKKIIYLISLLIATAFVQSTTAQVEADKKNDTLQAHLEKAQLLIKKGEKEDASKILTGIMAGYPDSKEAVQWWLIANMKRSPTGEVDAIAMLDSLNKCYPTNTGILFYKIFIQAEHGMNKKALKNVKRLIMLQPDSAGNWVLKGQILQGLNKHKEACSAFDKALKLKPSGTEVWGMKASSLSKLKKYEESILIMNKVVELSPDIAENYYNRGCIYCLKGDKNNALLDLKKAFNMNAELKKYAITDPDLKSLLDDNEFKDLTK